MACIASPYLRKFLEFASQKACTGCCLLTMTPKFSMVYPHGELSVPDTIVVLLSLWLVMKRMQIFKTKRGYLKARATIVLCFPLPVSLIVSQPCLFNHSHTNCWTDFRDVYSIFVHQHEHPEKGQESADIESVDWTDPDILFLSKGTSYTIYLLCYFCVGFMYNALVCFIVIRRICLFRREGRCVGSISAVHAADEVFLSVPQPEAPWCQRCWEVSLNYSGNMYVCDETAF
jgi:hypothetical protein